MPLDPARILAYLREHAGRPLRAKELAKGLELPPAEFAEFREQLHQLEEAGVLFRLDRQRYVAPERLELVTGRVSTIRSGAGFVVPESGGPDVFVPADALATANDGDLVVVRVDRRDGDRAQGKVLQVLARGRQTIVGLYRAKRTPRGIQGVVSPQDPQFRWDVTVPPGQAGAAREGDVVVVRIEDWGHARRGPTGAVERVLGAAGDPGVDIAAIVHGHELPTDFEPAVLAAAEALRTRGITSAELAGREDLRGVLVFTIDPADAKDHDDALSIRRLDEGAWEVGVHIADVSHYVTEGSPLDLEAMRRGTSIYLVDRVIPMLPHPLSSDLCSLVPDEDRLALSLLLELDGEARVRGQRLVRSVIRSRHKLAYEHAQAVLDGGGEVDPPTGAALRQLAVLSRALRAQRQQRGSLDFDLPEARVMLDASGETVDIRRTERLESHRLIEDFMLLANETIAARAAAGRVPFIYRVHEKPDESRLEQLRDFAATLGYHVGEGTPRDLQRLLARAEGRPDGALMSSVVLRAMKQARYAAENLGHYGLAARSYTHFTSPIRRYPDLVVHRLCGRVLIDGAPAGTDAGALADTARHASERERVAADAERDSIQLKKVEFMARRLGEEFAGAIASVTAFGFFVLLDAYYVEGLVHVSTLGDDYYVFVEEQYSLVGERTRRRYRLGDRVRVRVSSVDVATRQVDFTLAEDGAGKPSAPARRPAGGPPGGGRAGRGRRPPAPRRKR